MFKSHLQAVNWCDVLHMVTLCLNENKLTANEEGFCREGWGDILDRSAPKWPFWATSETSKPMWKTRTRTHTHSAGALRGSDTSYRDDWNEMVSNCLGLLLIKRWVLQIMKQAARVSPARSHGRETKWTASGLHHSHSHQMVIKLWILTYSSLNTCTQHISRMCPMV